MLACLSHFYQAWMDKTDKDYKGGANGNGMTISFNIKIYEHKEKAYRYNVAGSFDMQVAISNNFWNEFDSVGVR